ncbi:hypothetical protein AA313_de0203691 [Arthrobotrys entomopaga]|nr:hypothetical protein AA313_de0203691 [Arthrobotrys entomopaga]
MSLKYGSMAKPALAVEIIEKTTTAFRDDDFIGATSRRGSRPQNLHLEIAPLIPQRSLESVESDTTVLMPPLNNIKQREIIDHAVSSSRSDSSSRCSTPTPSTTSSTDESSIATPTLETSSSPALATFTFSPPDNATRLLLRDRYLESQRPIIVGSKNSLDIPRTVFQEPKNGATLLDIFTPPETPVSVNKQETRIDQSPPPLSKPQFEREGKKEDSGENSHSDMGVENKFQDEEEESPILKPSGSYQLDDPKSPTKFGSGAWSNVYRGFLASPKPGEESLVIAVKQPLNNFSIPAIKREALILSSLQRKIDVSKSYQSIIPFNGFDDSTNSILLAALPGDNLEQFTTRCRTSQPYDASFNSRKLPIVGITQWLLISSRLISAFAFLKANGIIHGDVKPQNILTKKWNGEKSYDWISPDEAVSLIEPVVSDFSSAYLLDSTGHISDEEEAITAVTTIYCAPELLAAFLTPPTTPTKQYTNLAATSSGNVTLAQPPAKKSEPRPLPTFSSDQYGLSMTLLQTAIGSHPYSAAKMDIQRNMWVRQGDPMGFARADEKGYRCRVGGAVDRLLRGCFGKTAEGRSGVEELGERIQVLCREWRERNGEEAWVWGG